MMQAPGFTQRSGARVGGFTLIEVLVVVAILALLVAILIPSLNRARNQAKNVACRSNMHELGTAFMMYADSYRNYFPLTQGSGEDSFYTLWKGRLLKNVNILIDPATRNVIRPESLRFPEHYDHKDVDGVVIPYLRGPGKKANGDDNVGDICDNARYGRDDSAGGHSYEYNGCYERTSHNPAWDGKHKKTSHFRFFLSQIVLVHDNDDKRDDLGPMQQLQGCYPSRQGNGNNCPQEWDNHGAEGMNMMFADGHAEWVKKVAGTWKDMTANDPGDYSVNILESKNALIDQIMARSQYPWNYFRK